MRTPFLQINLLKNKLHSMAERSKEWHLCFGKTKELQDITKDLDKKIEEVETKDGPAHVLKFTSDTEALEWFKEKLKGFGSEGT